MEIIQTVRDAVIGKLKALYPETDVYAEEIPRTAEEEQDTEWFFVDVSAVSVVNLPPLQRDVTLFLSVDYHHPEETNRRYAKASEAVMEALLPALSFSYRGEERRITFPALTPKISGKLLHLSGTLELIVDTDGPTYGLMEELIMDTERKGN